MPSTVNEGPGHTHTYEMKGYRVFIYFIMAFWVLWLVAAIALSIAGRNADLVWIPPVIVSLLFFLGLRAQQRTPYSVTISESGARTKSVVGKIELAWSQVETIRFLRSPGSRRVEQIEIASVVAPTLTITRSMSNFDGLVGQLRELRPELIQD
jgi:hypothetical protein